MPETQLLTRDSRIYVAGHRGLVGAAIVRRVEETGCRNLLLRTRAELGLRDQAVVSRFFAEHQPQFVFLAAAKVGGILANATQPAEFLYENLAIQTNVIHSAWKHGTQKLLFLGSSCIYPKLAPQPIKDEYLLTGRLLGIWDVVDPIFWTETPSEAPCAPTSLGFPAEQPTSADRSTEADRVS